MIAAIPKTKSLFFIDQNKTSMIKYEQETFTLKQWLASKNKSSQMVMDGTGRYLYSVTFLNGIMYGITCIDLVSFEQSQ